MPASPMPRKRQLDVGDRRCRIIRQVSPKEFFVNDCSEAAMPGVQVALCMGMENTFYWYVTAMMAIAFLFSLRLPKQAAYLHHDL